MNSDSPAPTNDPNLSGLGRALLDTSGSKPSGPWVPPTAEELHAILPQYEIVKMLGRGGMGAVYMGRQTALDRPVAIKILSAQLEESDMGFTERFKNEARAMGKLNHPAIVSVYEFGQHESGLLYIIMEFVDGTDVAKMIAKSGRLHTEHAMAITAHVCDALAYAHERGIIHRDIKPANIMVGYDGEVKVADFGLAKVSTSGGQTLGLTQSGMAMGTLHFMAPEALMLGTAVDQRADIYAVGVMLFQMLTGKLPQGMFKMPSLQVPGLDPRYDGIIAKAMMEDREARYQSAREMRGDLDAILTQPVVKVDPEASQTTQPVLPTQARPQRPGGKPVMRPAAAPSVPQPPPRGNMAWLWVKALILAGLGGAVWMILPRNQPDIALNDDASATSESQSPPLAVTSTVTTTNPNEATKDRPFVNSLGMKFVPVPIIGGPTEKQRVLFSVWETRVQDYEIFVKEKSVAWPPAGFAQEQDHPAVNVSWEEAQAFCSWLTEREIRLGRISVGDQFRLPSDHEWSCAMGIGQDESFSALPVNKKNSVPDFPWDKQGTVWPPPAGFGNYSGEERQEKKESLIAGYRDEHPYTSPAGAFPPNAFGLHDLSGNATEWLADWYDHAEKDQAFRGGSWANFQQLALRTSDRDHRPRGARRNSIGFRVVLVPESNIAAASVAPPSSPGEAWTPILNKQEDFDPKASLELRDGWAVKKPGATGSTMTYGSNVLDGAIRAEFTGVRCTLRLRNYSNTSYNLDYQNNTLRLIWQAWDGAQKKEIYTTLKEVILPAPPSAEESYMLELRTVGKAITGSLNGRELIQVEDSRGSKAGRRGISLGNAKVRKIEQLILDQPTSIAEKPVPPPAAADEWQQMFQNDSLSGWTGDLSNYQIRNGILSGGGGNLVTPKEYGDFSLKFDLRLAAGAHVEMSVRGQSPPQPSRGAPNASFGVVLRDNTEAATAALEPWKKHGAIYGYQEALRMEGGSPGVWNEHEIRLENQHLTVKINGVTVQDADLKNLNRKAPGGRSLDLSRTRGQLAILGFKGTAEFRNVRIKESVQASDDAAMAVVAPTSVKPVPAAPAAAADRPPPFPAGAAQPVFTNALGMKFVRIPGTRNLVCIHETRRGDYAKFAHATSGLDQSWRTPSHKGVPLPQEDDHPVSMVSWEDAHKFNEWLGNQEKLRYRLPSSREWSILSGLEKLEPPSQLNTPGSKVSRVFPWGMQWPPPAMVGNLADEGYHQISPSDRHLPGYQDGFQTTAPVMRFKPSPSGVYDLAGNVAEFCRNLDEERNRYAVVRGSSFDDWLESVLTSAQRANLGTDVRLPNLGFRVVIEDYAPVPVAKSATPAAVQRQSPALSTNANAPTWINTEGRSIQAKFVRVEGANVLLDVAGKVTPVALSTLSAASQQQARDLQAAMPVVAKAVDEVVKPLLGLWYQRNDGKNLPFFPFAIFADGSAGFGRLGKGLVSDGRWQRAGNELHVSWPNGCVYEIDLKSGAPKKLTGKGLGDPDFTLEITHTGLKPAADMPAADQLADLSFEFYYKEEQRAGTHGKLRLLKDGTVVQQSPMNITGWKTANGYLMLMNAHDECLTLFNQFERKNGKWSIRGLYVPLANVEHMLEEQ